MKFKVGDKVKFEGTNEILKIVRIAKGGEVVVGPWLSGVDAFQIGSNYSIIYILEDEGGKWCIFSIENENNLKLVDPEQDLEKVKGVEMLFKVGDKVLNKYTNFVFKILKIAEEGEVIRGDWFDGDKEFEVPEKSYILEDEDERLFFEEVVCCDSELILVSEQNLTEQIETCRKKKEELDKELKDLKKELIELENQNLKFKVGDKVQYKGDDEILKIVKIAEAGETVKGPWIGSDAELKLTEKSYILEDEDGKWWRDIIDEECALISCTNIETELRMFIEDLEKHWKNLIMIRNGCANLISREYYIGQIDHNKSVLEKLTRILEKA